MLPNRSRQRRRTRRNEPLPAPDTACAVEPDDAPVVWPPWLLGVQVAVIALLAWWLVLALGGVYPASRALASMVMAGLMLLSLGWRLRFGPPPDAWERAWAWVWLTVTALIGVQLLPLPGGLLTLAGAYPPDVLAFADETFIRSISPYPGATLGYWAMFTTYWSAAWLVALLPRRHLRVLVRALVALVVFQAAYGLIAHIGRHDTVLGLWPARNAHEVVLGTYYNRNHIAGLLAMGLSLGIALLLFGVGRARRLSIREPGFLWVIGVGVIVSMALLLTRSRLGVAAGGVGLMVFIGAWWRDRHPGELTPLQRVWLGLSGGAVLLIALAYGLEPVLQRYEMLLEQDAGRLPAWAAVFDLPGKVWLLGAGAGAFEDVFKLVQPVQLRASYVHLHNDALQFVLEFGVLGAGLILLAVRRWWRVVRPAYWSGLQYGALGAVAAMAVLSLADFNGQIPGTAMLFWLSLGVLVNRALSRPPGSLVNEEESGMLDPRPHYARRRRKTSAALI